MNARSIPGTLRAYVATAACLSVSVALALPGCGGTQPGSSEAVVVTEPGVPLPTAGSAPTAVPAPTAPVDVAKAATPAVAATAPTKAEGWGTLKGQVVYGAEAPAPTVLYEKGKAPKDAEIVCSKSGPIMNEQLVVDSATKGVKNVLVFLSKPTAVNPEAKSAASQTQVSFDQKNCIFEPHVLGVMAGAKILLKSSDPVNHNVNARLKTNSQFNSILSGGQSLPFTPASAERQPAEVVCDIHPWMRAYWMILDHPYFAVTDEKGNFEIKNVPAGTQNVVVWQESARFLTPNQGEPVTIPANDTATKTWTLDPAKVKK